VKHFVRVQFTGQVELEIPDALADRAADLAKLVALSRVLAKIDNPDAPDCDACDQYALECGLSEDEAETDWDSARVVGVNGTWTLHDKDSETQGTNDGRRN
jgi:hypothetical protein